MAPRVLRAIGDDPAFGDEAQLFSCNASPVRKSAGGWVHADNYLCECAGAAFADRFDFPDREKRQAENQKGSDDGDSEEEGEEYGRNKKEKEKATGSFKVSDILKGVNLYELMGVSEGASQDEIKKAYRQLALTEHPDKKAVSDPVQAKKIQERFVQIQEAYELLSDNAKRMQYDSSLDFDDSLPKFMPNLGEDFYQVFGECFRRNARFSAKRPVPDIGGPDSKPEEWKKFYNFWHEFSSWRDPMVLAQKDGEELCDLNEAECREEKRWMMRENARVAKAYKQAERDRICDLVRLAEKFDPRIAAEKEAKKAEREAQQRAKIEERLAIQRAKDEAERKKREQEEEERRIEAEKKAVAKAAKDAIKDRVKNLRRTLRAFHPQMKHLVLLEQLNEVCLQFEGDDLEKLNTQVGAAIKTDVQAAATLIHKAIEKIGMKPVLSVKVEDDARSTSSGEPSEEAVPTEEQRQREREQEQRRLAAEAKRKEEQAIKEQERKEEKKRKEAERKVQQEKEAAKKRQQEKREEEKAKKAEEKAKKDAEEEAAKKEKQKEADRERAKEQAEKSRDAANARKAEMEAERIAQLFAADRMDRLQKLDQMSEEELSESLTQDLQDNPSIPAALRLLQARTDASLSEETKLDRAIALLHEVRTVWPLALPPPAAIKLPNAVRNRVKKARQSLRDLVTAVLPKLSEFGGKEEDATEWQRGIIDGSVELPVWSAEEREAEEKKKEEERAAAAAQAEEKKTASKKKKKETKGDEDLDAVLAEFADTSPVSASTPSPKKGGKKKK